MSSSGVPEDAMSIVVGAGVAGLYSYPKGYNPSAPLIAVTMATSRRSLFHHPVVNRFDRASGLPFAPLEPGNQTRLEDQHFTLYSQITLLPLKRGACYSSTYISRTVEQFLNNRKSDSYARRSRAKPTNLMDPLTGKTARPAVLDFLSGQDWKSQQRQEKRIAKVLFGFSINRITSLSSDG